MKFVSKIAPILLATACSSPEAFETPLPKAMSFLGYEELADRSKLQSLMGVDPLRTEWCAAFVNGVLKKNNIYGTNSNLARSFLNWGVEVDTADIQIGDIVIFPRGAEWQGHVGFYVGSIVTSGSEYYLILGGNQQDTVSIQPYPAKNAIGIRRKK